MRNYSAVIVLLLVASCTHTLKIPAPTLPIGQPLPEPALSSFDLPINVDLSSARSVIESKVPRDIDAMGAWTMIANDRVGIKYHVTRGDFALGLHGSNAEASVDVAYEVEACLRVKKPWPLSGYVCPKVASCGQGEPKRQLHVSARTALTWSPDWYLDAHTATSLSYPNRCTVTILNIDVTPQIDAVLKPRLDDGMSQLDHRIAELTNVQERVAKVWDRLWKPMQVAPDAWLLVRPQALRVAPLDGQGLVVSTAIGIDAKPLLTIGTAPAQPAIPPLPKLTIAPPGNSFFVSLRGDITYTAASAQLARALVGKHLDLVGHDVEIRGAKVEGVNNVAVLALEVVAKTGLLRRTKATIYLTGVPRIDATTSVLEVADLDFSVETRRALQGLEWLLHERLVGLARDKARWPIGEQLGKAKTRLEEALDKTVDGVSLRGHVAELRAVGVLTTSDRFAAYAEARGTASITVVP
ncbi:MAG: DUF4403 family protein [Kofleriaceae bacterium]|nr:DUF4403 family protein [Kofleriaceae bacterium]